MIQKNVAGVVTRFFYNLEDRLERVEDGSGVVIATYYYDPFGRRLWKEVGGNRTCFHYSDEGLVGEYDGAGVEIKTYGWKPGSTWSTDPLFMKQSSQYYWYHNDHLGTPQMLTTTSGAVVWSAKYTSFGKATIDSGSTIVNPFRLPGQYEDIETGLHYNGHRYYDNLIGKYLRVDPLRLSQLRLLIQIYSNTIKNGFPISFNKTAKQLSFVHYLYQYLVISSHQLNTYSYATSNPVIMLDQHGLIGLAGAFAGAVGGAIGGAFVGAVTGGWQGAVSGFVWGGVIGGAVGFFTGPVGGINAGTIGSGFVTGLLGEFTGPKELGYGVHPDGPGCNP